MRKEKKKKGLPYSRQRRFLLISASIFVLISVLLLFVGSIFAPEPEPLEGANIIFTEWQDNLREAQGRWTKRPSQDYQFIYQERDADSNCRYFIEVRNNEAQFLNSTGNNCGELAFTIDDLFNEILQTYDKPSCNGICACIGYEVLFAEYDAELGYPYQIQWRDTGNVGFELLDCPTPENRAENFPRSVLDLTLLED
jgi:hypothetical protein